MREDVSTPKKWLPKTSPIRGEAPLLAEKSPPKDTRVDEARAAVNNFLATAGDLHIAEVADALRKLEPGQLRLIEAAVPIGSGRTSAKCEKLRQVFEGVRAEKA